MTTYDGTTGYPDPAIHPRDGQEPLCDPAPPAALLSVELLRTLAADRFVGPEPSDVLNLGVDIAGNPVHYLITDWDRRARSLLLTRIPA